jgi:ferrochelatase
VNDVLRSLRQEGAEAVVLAPVGFVSDHIEVLFDLDHEARETSEQIGLTMVRAPTAGTHPRFVAMVRELIQERLEEQPVRRALGSRGPYPDRCPEGCCLRGS